MTELLDLIKEQKLKKLMEKAKSETTFDGIIKRLNELMPWHAPGHQEIKREELVEKLEGCFSEEEWEKEGSLEKLLWKLPGIAEKDKKVFIPLLAKNITENIERVFPHNKTKTDETLYKKVLIALMICLPFMDYQQAFDGNLYDPRVIILGINPRFKADTFYDYEQKEEKKFMVDHMKEVYDKPICEKNRPMLYKMNETDDENGKKIEPTDLHIAEDDYYYGKSGRFYAEYVNSELQEEHRRLCLDKEGVDKKKKNPLAFLELFPYASKNTDTWWDTEDLNHAFRLLKWEEAVYNDLKVWATSNMNKISKISKPIGDKLELKSDELLYSQQWILCLLYCILIKNRKFMEHDKWFVVSSGYISPRYKGDRLKRLEAFFNTALNIKKNSNFCFLACNNQYRYLTPGGLAVVNNGELVIKINEPDADRFWNTRDSTESQNATDSTNSENEEDLNNQAFRHLWGIDE